MSKDGGQFGTLDELLMHRIHKFHAALFASIEGFFKPAPGFGLTMLTFSFLVGPANISGSMCSRVPSTHHQSVACLRWRHCTMRVLH